MLRMQMEFPVGKAFVFVFLRKYENHVADYDRQPHFKNQQRRQTHDNRGYNENKKDAE